jgi:hypothetical protein
MILITALDEANEILNVYSGATMQVCYYTRSLCKIVIKLEHKDNSEILYLVLLGCKAIKGDFYLRDATLKISDKAIDDEGSVTEVTDRLGKFHLTSSGVFSIAKGREDEFGSFDNLLTK